MKKLLAMLSMLIALSLMAHEISPERAQSLAQRFVNANLSLRTITNQENLHSGMETLAYIFHLAPRGYLVVSAREELPPIMAYSDNSNFHGENGEELLRELLTADLSGRLAYPPSYAQNQSRWQEMERSERALRTSGDFLLRTTWNQTQPYNAMCPTDPVSNSRSLAGCPAIAMGQIVNYLQHLNGTRFDNEDDYYHNYSGRNYWIDNDYASFGFPSFPELNEHLDNIDERFRMGTNLSSAQNAALIFACGTALKQVYSSQASGTFAVIQAYNAYQRFGFSGSSLLGANAPDIFSRIHANITQSYPVHLAVVTPAWDAGHNVVVDGFSEEGMFHLNFGWGGSYDGWYNLPEGIPYGLTVVEGAVVDIIPPLALMSLPAELAIEAGSSQTIELVNITENPLLLQDIVFGDGLNPAEWSINPAPGASIPAMGILNLNFSHNNPMRTEIQSSFRLVFDNAWLNLPITFSTATANNDLLISPVPLQVSITPNPFKERCEFILSAKSTDPTSLSIYNLKGQLIKRSQDLSWDGKDQAEQNCPGGIYLYRIQSGKQITAGKLLKL